MFIPFVTRTSSSFGTIRFQLLFGMFLAALVLLLFIFLFLNFLNQRTKTNSPCSYLKIKWRPSVHLVNHMRQLHSSKKCIIHQAWQIIPFSLQCFTSSHELLYFSGLLGWIGCWSLEMGRWMLGICSLLPGIVVGREKGSNGEADKGSEEQLGIGGRDISAFKLCFLYQNPLSPSHMEGEAKRAPLLASLYLEVLEVGQPHETLVASPADPGDGNENRAALAHRRVLGAPVCRETENDRRVQSNRYVWFLLLVLPFSHTAQLTGVTEHWLAALEFCEHKAVKNPGWMGETRSNRHLSQCSCLSQAFASLRECFFRRGQCRTVLYLHWYLFCFSAFSQQNNKQVMPSSCVMHRVVAR